MAGSAVEGHASSPLGRHRLDPGREGQIELVGLLQQLPSFALPIPVSRRSVRVDDGAEQTEDDTAWEQQQDLFSPADAMSGVGASEEVLSEVRPPMRLLLDPVFPDHREAAPQGRASTLTSEDPWDGMPMVTLDRSALESGRLVGPSFAPVGVFEQSMGGLAGQVLPPLLPTSAPRRGFAGLADPRWRPTQDPGQAGQQAAGWPTSPADVVAQASRFDVPEGEDRSSVSVMPEIPSDDGLTGFGPEPSHAFLPRDGSHPDLDDPRVFGSWKGFSAVPPPAMKRRSASTSDRSSANCFNDGFSGIDVHRRMPQTATNKAPEARSGDDGAPSDLQVNGRVSMNGRRLGQVSASSQVRHASLPPIGQSRVNARSASLYPGTRIPQ